jgi:serine/threonine protein kinase
VLQRGPAASRPCQVATELSFLSELSDLAYQYDLELDIDMDLALGVLGMGGGRDAAANARYAGADSSDGGDSSRSFGSAEGSAAHSVATGSSLGCSADEDSGGLDLDGLRPLDTDGLRGELRDDLRTPPTVHRLAAARAAAYSTLRSTLDGVVAADIKWSELELLERLDSGAGAAVYRAKYKSEVVAVKRFFGQEGIARGGDPKALQAMADELRNEVRALSAVESERVVTLHGSCTEPPNICIVMQLVPNGSLFGKLYAGRPGSSGTDAGEPRTPAGLELAGRALLRLLLDCAEGMAAIHAAGLIHRDLKPHNLLLDHLGRCVVGDLGLSRRLEASNGELRTRHEHAGTCAYMAPEVVRADGSGKTPITSAADVYSFGVVVWELCARRPPWQGRTAGQIVLEVGAGRSVLDVLGPPADVAAGGPGWPAAVAEICRECLQAEPASRPSFASLEQRLRALVLLAGGKTGPGAGRPVDYMAGAETQEFWRRCGAPRSTLAAPHTGSAAVMYPPGPRLQAALGPLQARPVRAAAPPPPHLCAATSLCRHISVRRHCPHL